MTVVDEARPESRPFEADVAKLLSLMVHSVYSNKDVFLRELISNAADACEKLRYEAIADPALLGDDPKPRITLSADAENKQLTVEDNGIGMGRDEMVEALGTIARSGTKAFMDRIEAAKGGEGATLIGQFGVGFYSAFMVAERVDVISRRAGTEEATLWSSDGQGTFSVSPAPLADAPARGTRVILHLMADAATYSDRYTLERIVKAQSGHVPVPISVIEKPGAEPIEIADGAALWTKPKTEISATDYADFYRTVGSQFGEPAMTIHFRAEGRHEYIALAFIPSTRPFDLFDPVRKGHLKLYVKRVFITDEAEVLPRYLRFVRGLVDSNDLPLNVSREMIQKSPILTAIKNGVTSRILGELEKLAEKEPESYGKIWDNFGAVMKEGIYEDRERSDALLELCRFKTTTSAGAWRSLKDYAASLKENQTAIYYLAGDEMSRIESSPHLEGFRARGIEVLLLADPVDSFWVTTASYNGKPFKSVTQGAADLGLIPRVDAKEEVIPPQGEGGIKDFLAFMKTTLADSVSEVRASDRLTDSAVCLVAPEFGFDRQLEKMMAGSGRPLVSGKPVLEVNPHHHLVTALAAMGEDEKPFKEDAAHLLLDEARVLDGEPPKDPRLFADRLARVMTRSFAKSGA